MDRPTLLPIGVAILLFVSVALLWSMSSSQSVAPEEQVVPALDGRATIEWHPSGLAAASISSARDEDFILGYIHGVRRTWTMLLWRQAAEGRLSEWFGEASVPLDRHVHRLRIPATSRAMIERVSDSTRQRLSAYTAGVNAALSTRSVSNRAPLLALDLKPENWHPWHTLAVERLFSWLSTEPLTSTHRPTKADSSLARFAEDDALLRRFLHVHGLHRSVAWARQDSSTTLATRLVTGATARPMLQDVVIDVGDRTRITGGSLPGTPFLLSGTVRRSGRRGAAWSLLPGHAPNLRRVASDSLPYRIDFVRLSPRNADEQLVRLVRTRPSGEGTTVPIGSGPWDDGNEKANDSAEEPQPVRRDTAGTDTVSARAVPPDSIPVDSVWVLDWSGLDPATDIRTWRSARTSDSSAFALHEPAGLRVDDKDSVSVIGSPPFDIRNRTPDTSLHVVGRSAWTHTVAHALGNQRDRRAMVETQSDTSAWAGHVMRDALPNLRVLRPTSPYLREALTYLRNWDANYERASIGASLFETWMDEYRRDIGTIPYLTSRPCRVSSLRADSLSPDTTYFAAHRQRQAFRRAVRRLRESHGPDLKQWRWERVAPNRRYFPVWSADSLVSSNLSELASTRYAPIDMPATGHPSTPPGGPSIVAPTEPARSPTTWVSWTSGRRDHLFVRRYAFDVDEFFSRPFLRRDIPPTLPLTPGSETVETSIEREQEKIQRTRLLPSDDER
ncbi:hypothetical protein CRI94_12800 [Longibacter salinarum]|uniref:Penicillin amidase n=1 Tax=Longibacter salinarum TaxID=1850348 RepID=A0A2A8CW50_9BACT|nr:penicillin acylase family protein [Longibacter salinarum]PEN12876.1 hypothetical protein CRI94_12800 [Longibacter salinarum]